MCNAFCTFFTFLHSNITGGWAQIAYGKWNTGNPWSSSSHTLPREVTWCDALVLQIAYWKYPEQVVVGHRHPELRQLVFSPLDEQTALRGDIIGRLKPQPLAAGQVVALGLPPMLGNQSELNISFARPASVGIPLTNCSSFDRSNDNTNGASSMACTLPLCRPVPLRFVLWQTMRITAPALVAGTGWAGEAAEPVQLVAPARQVAKGPS
eukprot:COSAG02_NODE_9793_length_2109_cov_1.419900_3_plen_209_part_00